MVGFNLYLYRYGNKRKQVAARNHEPAAVRFGKDKRRGGGPKRLDSKSSNIGDGTTRLNKFIAHAGVCSRREADELIQLGTITVNGETITEMGYKVKPSDVVSMRAIHFRMGVIYLAINKPKNFSSACDNPPKGTELLED